MNRLARETSPYLRQHADNPVDWYPWGDEAFARATAEDKPVLLSIGYSACHWCHVMAHESFEDRATAGVMNDLFVNIKVDREERPDVDAIYMEATQTMTGHGGWPMTVFLTPDGKPFYCGTYFPNERRHGMPAFREVCAAVDEAWRQRRPDILEQAEQLTAHLGQGLPLQLDGPPPGAAVVEQAVQQLLSTHDDAWGGFGGPPKFPPTMALELLLRVHRRAPSPEVLAAVTTTLDAMASGGIYDHLGGGFARYSVDGHWLVPHFEKMLYDQSLLARVYLHAWQHTGEARYRQVLDETIGYVLRDLRHPDGGFYSAEDADSEGVEGKYYVWTPVEMVEVLGDDAGVAADWYGVTAEGNFEGTTILNRIAHRGDLARPASVESARARLFDARARRVRPALDDKVLAEWNGLFLATLAEAAFATGNTDWLAAAVANGEFLARSLRGEGGRWLRSWQAEGGARHLAFAADHAALVDAYTRLAEATGEARWLSLACETADALVELFWDGENGGFFTTGHDAPALVTRPKDYLDNATPSANSMAALALLRLGSLTGDSRYTNKAEEVLRLLGGVMERHPSAFPQLLAALDLVTGGVTEVVIAGDRPDLVDALRPGYHPEIVLAWGERYDSPLWAERDDGRAYVCRHYTCQLPATDVATLEAQLTGAATKR